MEIDRRAFSASLGGPAAIAAMGSEAKAEALEHYMLHQLNVSALSQSTAAAGGKGYPTVAEIAAQIEDRSFRRGVGDLFTSTPGVIFPTDTSGRPAPVENVTQNLTRGARVQRLPPMPARPTLADFFNLRFTSISNHVLQSATRALKTGMSEEIVLACLLHDVVQSLIKVDHGWWGAQLFEPYIPERSVFAIRYHQALRFYNDPANGYTYPEAYYRLFGEDYKPEPYIDAAYKMARNHKWYFDARMVTLNDTYAFELNVTPTLDPFVDIIGRHFKQPKEGLGLDNSPVAHMWRSMANPDAPI
jgi:hypothetical protein